MIAIAAKETTIGAAPPLLAGPVAVEDLRFVTDRMYLIDNKQWVGADESRARDRTTALIKRWHNLGQELQIARLETLRCCEARSTGKGDGAALFVVDRARFDGFQDVIKAHLEEIGKIEQAIRALDVMGHVPFLFEMGNNISGARSSRQQAEKQYSAWLGSAVSRGPGKSIEELQQIPDVKKRQEMLARAKIYEEKTVAELEPMQAAIIKVLESVGC